MPRRGLRRSINPSPRSQPYYSPNPAYLQALYPATHPPLEPHYTVPYSHLLDPPYSAEINPPLWWEVLTASAAANGTNITYVNGALNAGIPTGSTNTVLLTDGSGNTRYDYNITNPGAHTMSGGGLYVMGSVRTTAVTVAALPPPGHMGARNFVTDSTATLSAGMGNIITGGGTNSVPVYDDGTNWRIGG